MRLLIIILVFIVLGACTSNTIYKKPDDLIPEEQMVDLLTDMYLATAAKNIKTKNLERNLDYLPLIYKEYGIDSLRFQKSNLYYMSRIDDYETIYKKVNARLQKMLDTTQKAQKIKDSLKLSKKKKQKLKKEKKFAKETPLTEKPPKQLDLKQE